MLKNDPVLRSLNKGVVNLPSPSALRYAWGGGSLLGVCLITQILRGVFLAIHYCPRIETAFSSVRHISRDVTGGWAFRGIHANGARGFFIFLYLHFGRGLYYNSFREMHVWAVGVSIFLATMAIAFLGYVLPWGQMSFWGATVITNLFSAIPGVGGDIVVWLWGGFSVDNPTLSRFFSLHYLLPFILRGLAGIHLVYLHEAGSRNPLGVSKSLDKVPFHPYFIWKDLVGFLIFFGGLRGLVLVIPWALGDVENFIPANPLVTPPHIQPEWYFLFAYAILRAIPSKLGGVVALAMSVLIFYVLPLLSFSKKKFNYKALKFWVLRASWAVLTYLGAQPVEYPFDLLGRAFTVLYFIRCLRVAL